MSQSQINGKEVLLEEEKPVFNPFLKVNQNEKEEEVKEEGGNEEVFYFSPSKYDKSESGYTGLANQGATCYLNSLIQTMFMTPELREKLYNWRYDESVHGSALRSIPLQLQLLFAKLQMTKKMAVGSKKLTKSFGWTNRDSFVQHDVNELLRKLLDAFDKTFSPNLYKRNEELKHVGRDGNLSEEEQSILRSKIQEKYEPSIKKNREELVSDMYSGKVLDYIFAKDRQDENGLEIGRRRIDSYSDINLVIQGKKSIEEALRSYIEPEVMDGDNKWMCEALGNQKVDAIKGLRFLTFPPLLTLNLKRFDYNPISWTLQKLGHKVTFPFELDMHPYLDEKTLAQMKNLNKDSKEKEEEQKPSYRYELFSVMIHSGSANFGHYYAYIKSFEDGQWYSFNDRRVNKIDEEEVKKMFGKDEDADQKMSTNAYMLMYRNIDRLGNREPFVPTDILPDYVKTLIEQKNKEIEVLKEKVERFENSCFLRVAFGPNERCILKKKIAKKKDMTIRELREQIFQDLRKKYPDFKKYCAKSSCIRLRPWNFGEYQKAYHLNERLGEDLNFGSVQTVFVDVRKSQKTKEEEEEGESEKEKEEEEEEEGKGWPTEIVNLMFPVTPLFPYAKGFSSCVHVTAESNMTLLDLRKKFAAMFKQSLMYNCDFCDEKHITILEVKKKNEIVIHDEEKDELEIEKDLGFRNGSSIYAELFEKTTRSFDMLYTDLFCVTLKYNNLSSPSPSSSMTTTTEEEEIVISREKTLNELKHEISKKIDKQIDEFRMLDHSGKPFLDMEKKVNDTSLGRGWNSIKLELGKPLSQKEHMVSIYRLIMTLDEAMEIENEENRKFYSHSSYMSLSMNDEIKEEEEELIHGDDPNVLKRFKNKDEKELKRILKILKKKVKREEKKDDFDASISMKKKTCRLIEKMVVSEDEPLIELKKRALKFFEDCDDPKCLRLREKSFFDFGKVIRENEKTMKENKVKFLGSYFGIVIQQLDHPEDLGEFDIVLRVKQWKPSSWMFGKTREIIYNTKERNLKERICEELGLKEEEILISIAPPQLEKIRVSCIGWNKEKVSDRLGDYNLILWRRKDEKEKFNKVLLHTLFNVWILGNQREERGLTISTEFDAQASTTTTTTTRNNDENDKKKQEGELEEGDQQKKNTEEEARNESAGK